MCKIIRGHFITIKIFPGGGSWGARARGAAAPFPLPSSLPSVRKSSCLIILVQNANFEAENPNFKKFGGKIKILNTSNEISHPYPQLFCGYQWIDHIHKRLSCVHVAANFCKIQQCKSVYSPLQKRKHDTNILSWNCWKKLIKVKQKLNKHLHWNIILVKCFRTFVKIYIILLSSFWPTVGSSLGYDMSSVCLPSICSSRMYCG